MKPKSDMLKIFDEALLKIVYGNQSDKVRWLRNLRRTLCIKCGESTIFDKCTKCQKAESDGGNNDEGL